MARTQRKDQKRRPNATIVGMGSVGIAGTGRVDRLVNAVLRGDPFATDAQNLHGDFSRALARASQRASLHR